MNVESEPEMERLEKGSTGKSARGPREKTEQSAASARRTEESAGGTREAGERGQVKKEKLRPRGGIEKRREGNTRRTR